MVIPKKRGTTMETIGRTRGQVGQVVKPSATNRNPEALNPGAPQNHSYPSPSVRRSPQSHEALISWLEQSETYTRPREAAQTARPESCQHHECHTPASCRCFLGSCRWTWWLQNSSLGDVWQCSFGFEPEGVWRACLWPGSLGANP